SYCFSTVLGHCWRFLFSWRSSSAIYLRDGHARVFPVAGSEPWRLPHHSRKLIRTLRGNTKRLHRSWSPASAKILYQFIDLQVPNHCRGTGPGATSSDRDHEFTPGRDGWFELQYGVAGDGWRHTVQLVCHGFAGRTGAQYEYWTDFRHSLDGGQLHRGGLRARFAKLASDGVQGIQSEHLRKYGVTGIDPHYFPAHRDLRIELQHHVAGQRWGFALSLVHYDRPVAVGPQFEREYGSDFRYALGLGNLRLHGSGPGCTKHAANCQSGAPGNGGSGHGLGNHLR